MKADVYWIPGPWRGRLGIVPRPRGGDWLDVDLRAWREGGVDVVVSLLTPEEEADLDLQHEEVRSRGGAIEFFRLPIPDRGVPASPFEVDDLLARLESALASGKSVAVHCRQGIGRSSLIAALFLGRAGYTPEEAFHVIGLARGVPVPETDEQRNWAVRFAADAAVRAHDG